MSALLSKLNLSNLTIVDPITAMTLLASRGEWSALCKAVASHLATVEAGSVVTFASINLQPSDFARTTATDSKAVGDIDYSGITAAARAFGLQVKRLTDVDGTENLRGFYVPRDRQDIIDRVAASKAKAAAKAKAKAKAASKSK